MHSVALYFRPSVAGALLLRLLAMGDDEVVVAKSRRKAGFTVGVCGSFIFLVHSLRQRFTPRDEGHSRFRKRLAFVEQLHAESDSPDPSA